MPHFLFVDFTGCLFKDLYKFNEESKMGHKIRFPEKSRMHASFFDFDIAFGWDRQSSRCHSCSNLSTGVHGKGGRWKKW